MNKRIYLQSAIFATIFVVYFFSSPSVQEKIQSWRQEQPIQTAKEKSVPIARAEDLEPLPVEDPQPEIKPEPEQQSEPFPEPEPMSVEPVPAEPPIEVIEIINSCGPFYEGTCVNVRSGPGTKYPSVSKLRNGVVLRVAETITDEEGKTWYKIDFKEAIRYPERISKKWYVNSEYARLVTTPGTRQLAQGEVASTTKRIDVDLSKQTLYAYDGDTLFMEQKVSTGIKKTPTPRGTFTVFKKTPSRYMQGPLPGISKDYYDLPGVPWNLYFTQEGAIFHGAYWHNSFGKVYSHGCVNLPVDKAEELYAWADLGTKVTIHD